MQTTPTTQQPTTPDEEYYRKPVKQEKPNEQKHRWGIFLLGIGVIWLVFSITTRDAFSGFGWIQQHEAIPTESFTANQLTVIGANDDIKLIGWNEDTIQVDAIKYGYGWNGSVARENLGEIEVLFNQEDDALAITIERQGTFSLSSSSVDMTIHVPQELLLDLQLQSGEIQAEDLVASGSISTVSGDIVLRESQGDLQLSSNSGDVQARQHIGALSVTNTSGEIDVNGEIQNPELSTISGDIRLDGPRGQVVLSSISGDISVDRAEEAYFTIENTSGDIQVRGGLAEGQGSQISNISGEISFGIQDPQNLLLDVVTTSGSIDSNLNLDNMEEERRSLNGQIGDGSTTLSLSTTSGDIQVDRR